MQTALRKLRYPLVGLAVAISVGAPLGSAWLADIDGALPWALVGLGALATAILGLVAFYGLRDSDVTSNNITALSFADMESRTVISDLLVKAESLGGSAFAAHQAIEELKAEVSKPAWQKQLEDDYSILEAKGLMERPSHD